MDKFGVVLDDEKTKQSGLGVKCESCGKEIPHLVTQSQPQPPRCPHCGSTKNFEKSEQ
jgi:DNA-directed RNA polymerase subunit RPC12/RpoP